MLSGVTGSKFILVVPFFYHDEGGGEEIKKLRFGFSLSFNFKVKRNSVNSLYMILLS